MEGAKKMAEPRPEPPEHVSFGRSVVESILGFENSLQNEILQIIVTQIKESRRAECQLLAEQVKIKETLLQELNSIC